MESQHSNIPPIKEIKIVSRKSNEEIPDDIASGLDSDENRSVDDHEVNPPKFHKNDDVGEGVED